MFNRISSFANVILAAIPFMAIALTAALETAHVA